MHTLHTPTLCSDNADDVAREKLQAENLLIEIGKAMDRAEESGDTDAYDAAADLFNDAYSQVVALEGRLLELEDRSARKEERSNRAWARWASL